MTYTFTCEEISPPSLSGSWALGIGLWGWDFGLEAEIWASGMDFVPDAGL